MEKIRQGFRNIIIAPVCPFFRCACASLGSGTINQPERLIVDHTNRVNQREIILMARLDWATPVASLLNRLQQNGYKIFSVSDGEETTIIEPNFSDAIARKHATNLIVDVEYSAIALIKDKQTFAVHIVLGNEPHEIVQDYTDNEDLEKVIDSYIEQWEDKKCPVIKE